MQLLVYLTERVLYMGIEGSRINLIIDMPDNKEQYRMVEAYIEKIRDALDPEHLKIWETRISDGAQLTAEKAAAYLLYLSYQHLYLLNTPLSTVTSTTFYLQEYLLGRIEKDSLTFHSLEQRYITNIMQPKFGKAVNPFMTDHALQMINEQYTSLTLESLALQLHVSHSYLCRILSKDTGCSFSELLHYRRILAAASIFINSTPAISMEALSIRLGYTSLHYFHRVFKRYTQLTPVNGKRLVREIAVNHSGSDLLTP